MQGYINTMDTNGKFKDTRVRASTLIMFNNISTIGINPFYCFSFLLLFGCLKLYFLENKRHCFRYKVW